MFCDQDRLVEVENPLALIDAETNSEVHFHQWTGDFF